MECGGRRINGDQRGDVAARSLRASVGLLAALALALLGAGILAAPPAAAIDDPSRPTAQVTQGPSCRPGGLVVEVVAGTSPYAVTLATTRTPTGEDDAVLEPGQSVELSTGDVAPGETIDARLEFEALDGSARPYVDELESYTFTRPTAEDCELATSPPPEPTPIEPAPTAPAPQPSPEPEPAPAPGPTPAPDPSTPPSTPPTRTPAPAPPSTTPSTTPPSAT
ncbi:hypothetical protein, partial [Blastococcus sp. CCUG 61487]|uniref:hypothetical protein n=1 Tax=Blastococcus sp. CCUG 61487 TaxID=1840703 RepID=UPI001BB0B1D0